MTKNNTLNKNDEFDNIDDITEHINLLILYATQLDDKNNNFKNVDNKLENYIVMIQDIIEHHYNFCLEQL